MAHSESYQAELKNLHNNKKSFGKNANIPDRVKKIIETCDISSLLDYGAGKGNTSIAFREKYPEIKVYSYDPATFPTPLPENVDLIYSSDVLEHIEPDLIDETLNDLSSRATKYQYHLIACHPAKKSLSDGRNAHLIVESPKWWRDKLLLLTNWKIVDEEVLEYTATVKKGPPILVTKYIVVLEKI